MNPNNNLYNDYARFSLRYLDTVNQIMRQLDLVNRNFYQIATRNYRYGPYSNRYSTRYTNPDNIWTTPLNINTNTNPTMQNWATNFLNNTFWNNVVVYPTQTEIENATSQVALSDLPPGTISCPITMERFTENTEILRINHCGHVFTRDAILRWFRNHVNCPVCRHDIRTQTQGATASERAQRGEENEEDEENETNAVPNAGSNTAPNRVPNTAPNAAPNAGSNAGSNTAPNADPNVNHQVYQFDFTIDSPDMMTNIINGLSNLTLSNDLTNNLANTINNNLNSTNNSLRNRYNPSRYNSGSGSNPNNTDHV
jgi:hypothetical protein